MPIRTLRCAILAVSCALLLPAAHSALPDEIQVYTDDINAPGEFGLELHVNTTPRGIRTPGYPGEVVTHRGLRITPEFSYGITPTVEAGLYLPLVLSGGNWSAAGVKSRLKWLPVKGDAANGGIYAGANLELSNTQGKFNPSRHNAELRILLGDRGRDWLVGINPIFTWAVSSSQEVPAPQNPQFSLNTRVTRRVTERVLLGVEYYNSRGTWRRFDPGNEQGKSLFFIVEVDSKLLPFHLGIGRGLNDATDRLTVKAIFDIPF